MIPVVYVAGKFTGDDAWQIAKNVHAAKCVGIEVAYRGAMPLIPHANTDNFHGTLPAKFWYEGTLELFRRCDAIVMMRGWKESRGSRGEHREAKKRGVPIFYEESPSFFADLYNWIQATKRKGRKAA